MGKNNFTFNSIFIFIWFSNFIYHVGIEQDIFSESLLCELGINTNILNTEELLKDLAKAPISCKDVTFTIFGLSLATFNAVLSIIISYILFKIIIKMIKTDKKTLEEIIRVDHAGERGAIKIYEGQLLALKTFKQDEELKRKIEDMKEHEKEHYEFFDKEIQKRNIKPTKLLPLWDLMGITLGFGTAMMGKKAAMLCTASVEEVIDGHYKDQTYKLQR